MHIVKLREEEKCATPKHEHSRHSGEQCRGLERGRNLAFSRNHQPKANVANVS